MSRLKRGKGLRKQDSLDLDAVLKEYGSEALENSLDKHLDEASATEGEFSATGSEISETKQLAKKRRTKAIVKQSVDTSNWDESETSEVSVNGSLKTRKRNQRYLQPEILDEQNRISHTNRQNDQIENSVESESESNSHTTSKQRSRNRKEKNGKKHVQINSEAVEIEAELSQATSVSENTQEGVNEKKKVIAHKQEKVSFDDKNSPVEKQKNLAIKRTGNKKKPSPKKSSLDVMSEDSNPEDIADYESTADAREIAEPETTESGDEPVPLCVFTHLLI